MTEIKVGDAVTYQTEAPVKHISLSSSTRSWGDLIHQIERGDISYDTPYQRGEVWTSEQRMLLIYSIISGTPIPAIIMNRRPAEAWFAADGAQLPLDVVIDGKQRLSAVRAWLSSDFAVPASWFDPEDVESTEDTADGPYVRYRGLRRPRQRFFDMSAHIPVAEASVKTVAEEAAIYLRVNGSGTMQTQEDMDRAAQVVVTFTDGS
jgi:hypothetical protein